MLIDDWLKGACEDAARRGLPELKPMLETFAHSTAALREADRAARSASTDAASGTAHLRQDPAK